MSLASEQIFADFIANRKILIADPSPGVRTGIVKVLKDLGAKTSNITTASQFENAMGEVRSFKPHVIICDYHLDDHCGLRLIEAQHEIHPSPEQRLSVLVTGNSRESTIAEAAEEDVDTYLLKPFTLNLLRDYLLRAIEVKVRPTPYQKAIVMGKALLGMKDWKRAEAVFLKAVELTEKPSMAYYYHGQVCRTIARLDQAELSYNAGLRYNEYHYRCLTGLCELLLQMKKDDEAYTIARRVISVFPISRARLDEFLRLIVRIRKFDEIDALFAAFYEMDYRSPELTRCMAASLVVAGIHYMENWHKVAGRAKDLFEKAMVLSERAPYVLREIITVLVDHGKIKDAEEFLKEFPPISKLDPTYQAMDLLVMNETQPASKVIDRGRELIKQGVQDPLIYEILIVRSKKAGLAPAAQTLIDEASQRWPTLKAKFESASG